MSIDVDILMRSKERILQEPTQVNMSSWAYRNRCGTVACIGGWACVLKGIPYDQVELVEAQRAIGLSHDSFMADRLFSTAHWDEPYHSRLLLVPSGTKAYAEIVAEYIDYFLAKHFPQELAEWEEAHTLPVVSTGEVAEEVEVMA